MKKTQIEIDAEADLAEMKQAVADAKSRVSFLEKELNNLHEAQLEARIKADSV